MGKAQGKPGTGCNPPCYLRAGNVSQMVDGLIRLQPSPWGGSRARKMPSPPPSLSALPSKPSNIMSLIEQPRKSYKGIMLNAWLAPPEPQGSAGRTDHTSSRSMMLQIVAHGQSITSVAVGIAGALSLFGACCSTWLRCGIPFPLERASLAAPVISVAPVMNTSRAKLLADSPPLFANFVRCLR